MFHEALYLRILINAFYLLALINPISKVAVLSALPEDQLPAIQQISRKASLAATIILLVSAVGGTFILGTVFRLQLYALQVAAGLVLGWVGFTALRRGVFFEQTGSKPADVALVPLACPLIAGPAAITACISLRAVEGVLIACVAIMLAVAINYLFMRFARQISRVLTAFNVMGAIIRITGLIVMTIGVQILLNGLNAWQGR